MENISNKGRPRSPSYYRNQLFSGHKQVARYGQRLDPDLDHHLTSYQYYHRHIFRGFEPSITRHNQRISDDNDTKIPLPETYTLNPRGHGILFEHEKPKTTQDQLNLNLMLFAREQLTKYIEYRLSRDSIEVFEDITLVWNRLTSTDWRPRDPITLGIIYCFEKCFPKLPSRDEINYIFREELGELEPSDSKKKSAMKAMKLCLGGANIAKRSRVLERYKESVRSYLKTLQRRKTQSVLSVPDYLRYIRYADTLEVELDEIAEPNIDLKAFDARRIARYNKYGESALKPEFYLTPDAHSEDFIEAISKESGISFEGLI